MGWGREDLFCLLHTWNGTCEGVFPSLEKSIFLLKLCILVHFVTFCAVLTVLLSFCFNCMNKTGADMSTVLRQTGGDAAGKIAFEAGLAGVRHFAR